MHGLIMIHVYTIQNVFTEKIVVGKYRKDR
ncbi:hypothetical protein OFAG_02340 [Oxalobacter formigenes HOxBLS]|uniref:Uncharacterized protein n=1 Tax=Oxalobacter paraformigenes TaxID=556268 RepID=T5LE35_9BURK|nr:hypothetical protein OFAG_02340 [Oxalobacter paraformigenes]